ncbi:MAG TPA: MgtC/SapB family protein [Nitratifractor sp.]|nr:MgtC/SapB family protein [Nitratifractor sp.]
MEYEIVKSLFITLALGFLIGIQRRLSSLEDDNKYFGGGRTFALIALFGYISAWIGTKVSYFSIVSFVTLAFLIALAYYFKVSKTGRTGLTTQLAALITFTLGLMVYEHLTNYAIFVAVLTIVILEIKPRLQTLERNISPVDVQAVTLLLVMSFIVLPILPDEMLGPYNLFNPYKTWLMAVIIALISFIGYIAIKTLGQKYGIFLTGAAGGFISSTAVSISLSKMFQKQYHLLNNYSGGIAIASTFMYIRVLFETFVINPDLALHLLPAYLGASISGLLLSWYFFAKSPSAHIDLTKSNIAKNPLQLSEALKFGLLFGIIYGAIAFIQSRYGDMGVYIVSFISGISDVDAITLSLSQMANDGKLLLDISAYGIIIASVTNSFVKLAIVFWLGGLRLGLRIALFFLVTLGIMGVGYLWQLHIG